MSKSEHYEWGYVAYYTDGSYPDSAEDYNSEPMTEGEARYNVQAFQQNEDRTYPEFDENGDPNPTRQFHLTYKVRKRPKMGWIEEEA